MSTNENILKSLAVLEQNLKDIKSAKDQVNEVVTSSGDLAQAIESYNSSFDGLARNLETVLLEIKSVNTNTISILTTKIKLFNDEIVKLSELDFKKSFNSAEKEIVKQFENDLKERLVILDEKTEKFDEQVKKLIEFDFTNSFKSIETKVIEQFEKDLKASLDPFNEKSIDLQTKINDLKAQIDRLEKIDLEKHFDELQKTLSDIFGAINAINLNITNVVQKLTGIVKTIGDIQSTLTLNHKEAKQLINSFRESTNKHLNDIEEEASKNVELLQNQIKSLSQQNQLLKKEVKSNGIIQLIGFVLVLAIVTYLIIKV